MDMVPEIKFTGDYKAITVEVEAAGDAASIEREAAKEYDSLIKDKFGVLRVETGTQSHLCRRAQELVAGSGVARRRVVCDLNCCVVRALDWEVREGTLANRILAGGRALLVEGLSGKTHRTRRPSAAGLKGGSVRRGTASGWVVPRSWFVV